MEMLTDLQIVAIVVTAVTAVLLFLAARVLMPQKTDDVDESLQAMINGFDFALPEEVEQYRQGKVDHADDSDMCFQLLFRRAVADIPLIRKIQSESSGIQRLKKNDILKDSSFLSYKLAEEMINDEINDVRREAEELKPGTRYEQASESVLWSYLPPVGAFLWLIVMACCLFM